MKVYAVMALFDGGKELIEAWVDRRPAEVRRERLQYLKSEREKASVARAEATQRARRMSWWVEDGPFSLATLQAIHDGMWPERKWPPIERAEYVEACARAKAAEEVFRVETNGNCAFDYEVLEIEVQS